MRITAPPTTHSCFYGIDTPNRSELIAANHTTDEIAAYLEADSLAYLSLEGLHQGAALEGNQYCDACFTGAYPVVVREEVPHPVRLSEYE